MTDQQTPEPTEPTRTRAQRPQPRAPQHGLPEVYVNEVGENFSDPTYLLHADGYYGDSRWYEGDRIVWLLTPNHTMQPLNAAAGDAMERWIEGLPAGKATVRIEDLLEAARMLPTDMVQKLDKDQYGDVLLKTALAIQAKRNGDKPSMVIPGMAPRTAGATAAPPMPNAAIEKHNPQGFGSGVPPRAGTNSAPVARRAMGGAPLPG